MRRKFTSTIPTALELSTSPVLKRVATLIIGNSKYTRISLLRMMVPLACASVFLNNTPLVALFIPIIKDWCRERGQAPSLFLIPLSYCIIVGGICSLIGSSTNLVGNGFLKAAGEPEFAFFETGYIGFPCAAAVLIFVILFGPCLLPKNRGGLFRYVAEKQQEFLSEVTVPKKSKLIGKKAEQIQSTLGIKQLELVEIVREIRITPGSALSPEPKSDVAAEQQNKSEEVTIEHIIPVPNEEIVREGDKLIFAGNLKDVARLYNAVEPTDFNTMLGTDSIPKPEPDQLSELTPVSKKPSLTMTDFPIPMHAKKRMSNANQIDMGASDSTVSENAVEIEISVTPAPSNIVETPNSTASKKNFAALTPVAALVKKIKSGADDKPDDPEFFEVVIAETCAAVGKTIQESNFKQKYGAAVVAVRKKGQNIEKEYHKVVVSPGDTLLLLAKAVFYDKYSQSKDFYVVSRCNVAPKDTSQIVRIFGKQINCWWWNIIVIPIFMAMIITAAASTIPLSKLALVACCLVLLLRNISAVDAINSVDWPLIVLIGASFALAKAITQSGLALAFGNLIASIHLPYYLNHVVVLVMTLVITAIITNNAAVAIMFPLAAGLAKAENLNLRPFAVAVTVGASACFSTTIGYQTNLMVEGPGGYQFKDFLLIGIPTTLVYLVVSSVLIPFIWKLQ